MDEMLRLSSVTVLAIVLALSLPSGLAHGSSLVGVASLSPVLMPAPTVVASKNSGIVSVAGLRPGSDYLGQAIMPADMARIFGRPRSVRKPYRETCLIRWPGIEASFTTYGLQGPCRDRPLHALKVTKRSWSVVIGKRRYSIGDHRRRLPRRASWRPQFGFELAWMPFVPGRTATVGAQIGGKNRIRAF